MPWDLELDAVESYCGTWSSYLSLIWKPYEQHRSSLELIWMRFDVSCRVLDRPLHLSIVETLPDVTHRRTFTHAPAGDGIEIDSMRLDQEGFNKDWMWYKKIVDQGGFR